MFCQDFKIEPAGHGFKTGIQSLHFAAGAMGAMSFRISELCLSFSPHPNIADRNFNLVHHFFRIQIIQKNEKGPVELGSDEEEGESESKV